TSPVFATATVVTPYSRRKGKEVMVESETPKKQKVQEQIDAHVTRELEEQLEREDQRMSEQIARDAKVFALELPLERRIELISDMVKSNLGWKVKDFRVGTTSLPVGTSSAGGLAVGIDPLPVGTSAIPPARIVAASMEVRTVAISSESSLIRSATASSSSNLLPLIGASSQDLGWKVKDFRGMTFEEVEAKFNLVWKQMEDFISISSKEEAERIKRKEWKLYDSRGVHHVTAKDKEIFMLVEKDYPLRKGLALMMICYKLQVENYSQMASDLILKIHRIASSLSQQEELPTASEEGCHCQKKREATAKEDCTAIKVKKKLSVKVK
nr:hypothetical protein [Tanacetum cinerariifolium]